MIERSNEYGGCSLFSNFHVKTLKNVFLYIQTVFTCEEHKGLILGKCKNARKDSILNIVFRSRNEDILDLLIKTCEKYNDSKDIMFEMISHSNCFGENALHSLFLEKSEATEKEVSTRVKISKTYINKIMGILEDSFDQKHLKQLLMSIDTFGKSPLMHFACESNNEIVPTVLNKLNKIFNEKSDIIEVLEPCSFFKKIRDHINKLKNSSSF